jgi:diguanylate cyclase (GGDEF)-like protein
MHDRSQPFTVIRFDLDHFKKYNDTEGHSAGDDVLKTFMRIVLEATQALGEAYRPGGDELGAILPGLSHDQAKKVAEHIRLAVENEFKNLKGTSRKPTTSVGVATFTDEVTTEFANGWADYLVYEAKKTRNAVVAREPRGSAEPPPIQKEEESGRRRDDK